MENFEEKNNGGQHLFPIKKRKHNNNKNNSINNINKKYKVIRRPNKYRSLKEILLRLDHNMRRPSKYRSLKEILLRLDYMKSVPAEMGKFTRPTPPPSFPSKDSNNDDDSCVSLAKEITKPSSHIVDLARFSFNWGKTDWRGRESRIADSVENYESVVHEPAVGYRCGLSFKKLFSGMHGLEAASMEDHENTDEATSRVKKPKEMMN